MTGGNHYRGWPYNDRRRLHDYWRRWRCDHDRRGLGHDHRSRRRSDHDWSRIGDNHCSATVDHVIHQSHYRTNGM